MADVRALLKAKRQEARISQPFATYTLSDQLKCVVCGTLIKHASAWEGHLGSKLHRKNATLLKEAKTREIQENAGDQSVPGKRKAEMDESDKQTDKSKRMDECHGHSNPNFHLTSRMRVPMTLILPKPLLIRLLSLIWNMIFSNVDFSQITPKHMTEQPLLLNRAQLLRTSPDFLQVQQC